MSNVSLEGPGFGHFSLISIRSIVKFRKVFVITLIISAYFLLQSFNSFV